MAVYQPVVQVCCTQIIVLHILIFKFLDSKLENKRFCTQDPITHGISFCMQLRSCAMAWCRPTLEVETSCYTINNRERSSRVRLKTSTRLTFNVTLLVSFSCRKVQEIGSLYNKLYYRGADKSLARPTSWCILFDDENISFDASLVIYINSTNIPPIVIINRIYENQNLLSL